MPNQRKLIDVDIFDYCYAWRNNSKRKSLYGRKLRVLFRGPRNSRVVEFENGQREIISGNALRRNATT